MNQPDYTNATADVLTAATLAKPEAKKAAVKAILESYFPATGGPETVRVTLPANVSDEMANIILRINGATTTVEKNRWAKDGHQLQTSQLLQEIAGCCFPPTGDAQPVPPILRHARPGEIALLIQADGRVEHWEGTTYRVTYTNLQDAMTGIDKLP